MNATAAVIPVPDRRRCPRFSPVRDMQLLYEGRDQPVPLHPQDISMGGMFVNTAASFPAGSVLKVFFRLGRTNAPVEARAEVRHCLPGIGVGVEFLNLSPGASRAISRELRRMAPAPPRMLRRARGVARRKS
jgi:PilZ domain